MDEPCRIFPGYTDPAGYGRIRRGGKSWSAHRYYYVVEHGPLPDGLELDHLCRVRACVELSHLEPVTRAENVRRSRNWNRDKPACKNGHVFTPQNTYLYVKKNGKTRRACRACRAISQAKFTERAKG